MHAEKYFDKPTLFYNKSSQQIKNSKEFLKLLMGIYKKSDSQYHT